MNETVFASLAVAACFNLSTIRAVSAFQRDAPDLSASPTPAPIKPKPAKENFAQF
jgi:hypothetical protein